MKQILLLLHFLGLISGTGAGLAVYVIGMLAGRFDPACRRDVLIHLFPLRYLSYFGLLLLILSGGMMISPYWPGIAGNHWLVAKLALVFVLVALAAIGAYQMHRIKLGKGESAFKMLGLAGKLSLVASLAVVLCAVYSFH